MTPEDAVGLYTRRGSVLVWQKANPMAADLVDPLTGTPRLSAGGRRIKHLGNLGETFEYTYKIRGYLQSKVTTTFSEVYGMVDDRQMQLTVPSLHKADVLAGIRPLPKDLLDLYTAGKFVTHIKGQPVARDKFIHNGISYIVKSSAVPIIDTDVTIAWRMLVAADTL